MQILIAIVLSFISFSIYGFGACDDLTDTCEYYTCIENDRACGKRGYPIGFGRKYCNKFIQNLENFSDDGKVWIENVKTCLIRSLSIVETNLSCKNFKKVAISHHVPCYLEAGYCELSAADKREVIKVVKGSAWRLDIIIAGYKVIKTCVSKK